MPNDGNSKKTWSEKIELNGREAVERIKELIEEGNVSKLIVRGKNDEFHVEVPVTAGVAVGGVATLFMPWLTAIGALAALVSKVEVNRSERRGRRQEAVILEIPLMVRLSNHEGSYQRTTKCSASKLSIFYTSISPVR